MARIELGARVQYLKGVGPRKAEALAAAGIHTVDDLLRYLPFRYEDRSALKSLRDVRPGETVTVEVEILETRLRATRRKNLQILEVVGRDETERLKAVWFNQAFLKDTLRPGRRVRLFGRIETSGFDWLVEMKNPRYELVEPGEGGGAAAHTGRIVPVYERIGPMSPRMLRQVIHGALAELVEPASELLPAAVRERYGLPGLGEAFRRAHFPDEGASVDELNAFRTPAQRRLILEELFHFYVGAGLRRRLDRKARKRRPFPVDDRIREAARRALPFRLTEAQKRVLKTIAEDLASPRPMRRLLQGDVGTGKTIVALLASIIVMEHGAQVAFMVPTELLAEQHFATLAHVLADAPYRIALLSASSKGAERERLLEAIAAGAIDLVVGTHALVQREVRFRELGLAIVDEQHRFGVLQRAALKEKGEQTDLLVMTATPIPRSLAMALFGHLDVSVLDEAPPGRKPVRTLVEDAAAVEKVYRAMEAEIAAGHQVYFVCPLVEESEKIDLRAAVATHRRLAEGPFAHRRVGLVHGRMSAAERERVMRAFADGALDVLVATTVIEVGVDVPNATMIVVDHAERFGLAQLHQLRGRVGRGRAPSTAVLLAHAPRTAEAERRLAAMVETTDGFAIAERDLEIRGPGDYFGTRQAGVPLFRIADVVRDRALFDVARREAERFLASREEVGSPDGRRILAHVRAYWGERFGLAAAG